MDSRTPPITSFDEDLFAGGPGAAPAPVETAVNPQTAVVTADSLFTDAPPPPETIAAPPQAPQAESRFNLPFAEFSQRWLTIQPRAAGRPLECRLSGRFNPLGFAHLLWVLPAVMLSALAYAYIEKWIPLIYVNLLLTVGYGAWLGLIAGGWVRAARVRNYTLAVMGSLAIGVLGWYFQWVFYFIIRSNGELILVLPQHLFIACKVIGQEGIWSIRDHTPKGWELYLVWLAEAGIVFYINQKVALKLLLAKPFCEETGKWIAPDLRILQLPELPDIAAVKRRLERSDFSPILELFAGECGEFNRSTLVLFQEPRNETFRLLRIESVVRTVDKKGKITETVKRPFPDYFISSDLYALLKEMGAPKPTPVQA